MSSINRHIPCDSRILSLTLILVGLATICAWAQGDIDAHPSCVYCGMDRAKFAHSRMYIQFDDGSTVGTCALHCAAVDLAANIGKSPVTILVGDYQTKTLIDAETALWVLGGDKMGVMTRRAKWAFADQSGADKFIQQHGGEAISFDEAMKAAYTDMYQDIKMIREKRKKKHHKQ